MTLQLVKELVLENQLQTDLCKCLVLPVGFGHVRLSHLQIVATVPSLLHRCQNLLYRDGFVVALGLRLPDLQLWRSVCKPDKTDLRNGWIRD